MCTQERGARPGGPIYVWVGGWVRLLPFDALASSARLGSAVARMSLLAACRCGPPLASTNGRSLFVGSAVVAALVSCRWGRSAGRWAQLAAWMDGGQGLVSLGRTVQAYRRQAGRQAGGQAVTAAMGDAQRDRGQGACGLEAGDFGGLVFFFGGGGGDRGQFAAILRQLAG
ncbi:hypothetical protein PLESTM_000107400 [Pleodorina starrii]|nr:hypothetical protein PLESTM_000107400 [Pleodorina starrii]